MTNNLTYVDFDTLKVGDIVGMCKSVGRSYGYQYPHCLITPVRVDRITPKRTKLTLNGYDYSVKEVKSHLVVLDEEARKENTLARKFEELSSLVYKLQYTNNSWGSRLFTLERIDDEDLDEVLTLVQKLHNKYILNGNKK